MDRIFALAAAFTFFCGSAALVDTTVEHSSVSGGGDTNSSTTVVHHESDAPRPVVVQPTVVESSPTVQKTEFKEKKHGLFGKTKIKGETTTVNP